MEVLSSPTDSARLSRTLYGIDWQQLLPRQFGNYELRLGSIESLFQFSKENAATYTADETFQPYQESFHEKTQYYKVCSDIFDFYLDGELVGVVVGNPSDWCSYYLRYILIKKEHQGHNLQNQWVRFIIESLTPFHIERIEVDFSPANTVQLFHYQRMGFYFVGTTLSERWGSLLRYVKFINPQRRDTYLDQFFHGNKNRV